MKKLLLLITILFIGNVAFCQTVKHDSSNYSFEGDGTANTSHAGQFEISIDTSYATPHYHAITDCNCDNCAFIVGHGKYGTTTEIFSKSGRIVFRQVNGKIIINHPKQALATMIEIETPAIYKNFSNRKY